MIQRLARIGGGRIACRRPLYYGSCVNRRFLSSGKPDDEEIKIEMKIEPLPRPNEDTETKRARLLYQSRKRGILETDLLLGRFAKKYLASMSREEMDEYDELLDQPDWDIYYWATRNYDVTPCPEKWEKSEIMAKLRDLAENKEKVVMRMPDL
ncbi:hypothetical protein TRICI_005031 [Trichomonascus ciferrii]|uniref:Succinate dehydrogenase assembly factor 2, mitochondrial n=1 Tax=Trichomonascus ciferrii TaxID=44093 RepID=A0A642V3U5_9ASCO|nr:hypothetical protein TRICI_005031 [Trichomonascus ciferrii]